MRRGPGGVGAINRQRLARVTTLIFTSIVKKKRNVSRNIFQLTSNGCGFFHLLPFFNFWASIFSFSFSGKVCYKGNRNSRHPAITSNVNSSCSLYLIIFGLNFRNAGVLPNQDKLASNNNNNLLLVTTYILLLKWPCIVWPPIRHFLGAGGKGRSGGGGWGRQKTIQTWLYQFTITPSVLLDGETARFLQIISWGLRGKIQTGDQEESRVQRSLSTDVCSHWCRPTGMYVKF